MAASVDQTVDPLDDMEQKIAYQLERAVLGQSSIALAPIEVKPVVEALFRAMEKVFRASQPRLRMELDEPTLRIDQRDLNELLGNLIENALKYGATEVLVTLASQITARVYLFTMMGQVYRPTSTNHYAARTPRGHTDRRTGNRP